MTCSSCGVNVDEWDVRHRMWGRVGLCRGCWRLQAEARCTRRRFRLGKEDKVFIGFMAVMFGLLLLNHVTGGALDVAYQGWRGQ